jgi:hypothetical protein
MSYITVEHTNTDSVRGFRTARSDSPIGWSLLEERNGDCKWTVDVESAPDR